MTSQLIGRVKANGVWALAAVALFAAPVMATAQVGGGQSNPSRGEYSNGQNYSFECSSVNNQYQRCRIPGQSDVRFLQRMSDSPCVQGSTWGVGNGFVWVTGGCRARFQITNGYSGNGSYNNDNDHDRDRDRGRHRDRGTDVYNGGYGPGTVLGSGRASIVRCESVNYGRNRCNVGDARSVRLSRQLGNASCVEGRSWGRNADRGQIWVSRGCRADFEVIR